MRPDTETIQTVRELLRRAAPTLFPGRQAVGFHHMAEHVTGETQYHRVEVQFYNGAPEFTNIRIHPGAALFETDSGQSCEVSMLVPLAE